jgi:hypothetical protein
MNILISFQYKLFPFGIANFEVGYQFNNMNNKFVRSSQESFPTFDGGANKYTFWLSKFMTKEWAKE